MGSSGLLHCGAELRLNTKDCCFICLKYIRPDLGTTINIKSESVDNSLWTLFRYLNINLEELILQTDSDKEPKSRADRFDITTMLCEGCSKINERVQELVQVIEVARMKIDYQINSIREKMRDAGRTPSRMIRYHRRMKSDHSKERIDRVRKQVSSECNQIVRKSKPRVVLTKMASDGESSSDSSQYFIGTDSTTQDENSPIAPALDSNPDSTVKIEGSSITDNIEESMEMGLISNVTSLSREQKQLTFVDFGIETTEVAFTGLIYKTEAEGSPQGKCDSEFSPSVNRRHSQKRINTSLSTSSIPRNSSNGKSDSYCKLCRKTYSDRHKLKQHHKFVHLGIRNFSCRLCDKKFGYPNDLKKHVDAVHHHRRFKCNVSGCIRNYSTIQYLKKHQKSAHPGVVVVKHTRRKEAKKASDTKCKICNKSYATKGTLQEHHLTVHLGIKKFECDICGKKFSRKRYEKKHRDTVH